MYPFPGKIVLGITGGIACGKSKVCENFAKFGWEVISTDSCTHYILDHDEDVALQIENRWGSEILDEKGNIDKRQLARLVFDCCHNRAWLECVLHPKVRERWMNLIDASSQIHFVVEIPLLFENKLNALFTNTISVHSSSSIQNVRLKQRGLSDEEIKLRVESQLPLNEKSKHADFVIFTDGEPEFLNSQIKLLFSYIK